MRSSFKEVQRPDALFSCGNQIYQWGTLSEFSHTYLSLGPKPRQMSGVNTSISALNKWLERRIRQELLSQQYRQSQSSNSSRTLRRHDILPSKTALESISQHSRLWSSGSSDCEGTGCVTALWTSFSGVVKPQLLLCCCSEQDLCY